MDILIRTVLDDQNLFGSSRAAHTFAVIFILLVPAYYFAYFLVGRYVRKKDIIRNPDLEESAFRRGEITADQLTTKYASNLSASSTMAALSVAMVLLFVVALIDMELSVYNRFAALMVCLLMTVASITMLFVHQLYDTITNPVLEPERRFRLRRLGSNLNVTGMILFITSMLLVVSMVSAIVTLIASFASCIVMTLYIEERMSPAKEEETELAP